MCKEKKGPAPGEGVRSCGLSYCGFVFFFFFLQFIPNPHQCLIPELEAPLGEIPRPDPTLVTLDPTPYQN